MGIIQNLEKAQDTIKRKKALSEVDNNIWIYSP